MTHVAEPRQQRAPSGAPDQRIRPLSPDVVNLIAAGEIIQRPANAARELLDNAVDSGATSISLLVKEGGMKLLQVQDNGCGIRSDDLPVLCQRHTTSKLTDFDDLTRIQTLGFRGEALASLSYVSILSVTTKRKADEHAWRASYDSSEIKGDAEPCAGVDGTTVTVDDLFYNVPMRKKAIRNPSEEYNLLLDVVQRYAVYHAGTSFSLRRTGNSRIDVHTQRGTDRRDTIRHVYGQDIGSNLKSFEIERTTDERTIRLEGYMTGPGFSSAKKTKLVLFVNGRCVESPVLRRCVDGVYGVLVRVDRTRSLDSSMARPDSLSLSPPLTLVRSFFLSPASQRHQAVRVPVHHDAARVGGRERAPDQDGGGPAARRDGRRLPAAGRRGDAPGARGHADDARPDDADRTDATDPSD